VVTGGVVGNAVQRNRLRRQIRACIQNLYAYILPGYDLLVIVRHAAQGAQFARIESAVWEVFNRAKVIETQIDNEPLTGLPE
jgi:ribonuclease P protein component